MGAGALPPEAADGKSHVGYGMLKKVQID